MIFSKSYLQNCIKTMDSWFLDGKKSTSAKMELVNFLAHSLHIAIPTVFEKNAKKKIYKISNHHCFFILFIYFFLCDFL